MVVNINEMAKWRKDFPMLQQTMHGKPLIYFDSAATAQKPSIVIDTMSSFYQEHYATVHRAIYELAIHSSEKYQQTRLKVQALLNAAKMEEIVFTGGSTESINLVASSFGKAFVRQGDEILISAMEHHSNIVPWQILCQDRGAVLKVIPMNERGELCFEEYQKLLSHQTRLVAITHVSNALGTINPVKEMIAEAHRHGAHVLVDGAQSVPHMKVDVQDLDADFYVFSSHKFYGPTGLGVLYGKESLLNAMPPFLAGGDMIESVSFEKTTYNSLPLKFEAGTPKIAEVIGLGAAIDYINSIGLDKIQSYEHHLQETLTQKLLEIPGLRCVGTASEKGAIISFTIKDLHPLDIGTFLDFKGIAVRTGHHCAQPIMHYFKVPALVRASLSFYNTFEEVDLFIEGLHDVVQQLR